MLSYLCLQLKTMIGGFYMKDEIIKVNFENETVSARDLYESVNNGKERFSKWFEIGLPQSHWLQTMGSSLVEKERHFDEK